MAQNSHHVRFNRELDIAYSRYFQGVHINITYWPRALRTFLVAICNALICDTPAADLLLSTCSITREDISKLSLFLNSSATTYVNPKRRILARDVLCSIQKNGDKWDFRPDDSYVALQVENETAAATSEIKTATWPTDIYEVDDLVSSLSCPKLRLDVHTFLVQLISRQTAAYRLHFDAADIYQRDCPLGKMPIQVFVPPEKVEAVRQLVDASSRESGYGEGPSEFVEILGETKSIGY